MAMPPAAVCDRARQTKDARFDGLFFTGVRSTRIYCRPVCPAPTPKPQNIVYFPSAAAAAGAGYRPCLRCRPELSPEIQPGDESVRRALALIAEGWLEEGSVETLAQRVGVSARHLRRLFLDKAGATPLQVHQAHRVLLAKQLLTETALPVTQVALAAGFASIRRFNDTFRARCGVAPSAFRRRAPAEPDDGIRLRLAFRPPFDFAHTLAVLREHALVGIERVSMTAYERIVGSGSVSAWINVTADSAKPELLLRAYGIKPEDIQPLVRRVRRLFDLDADIRAAHRVLQRDPRLSKSISRHPGLRIPGAWEGFELAVAAALGADAKTGDVSMLQRLLDRYGPTIGNAPKGLNRRFPGSEVLATAHFESTIGAPSRNADAVRRLAAVVRDRRLDFGPGQRLDEFVDRFVACTDMPRSTAHLVAWRALGDPDAWPHEASGSDGPATGDSARLSNVWRPWRGYAALHLDMPLPHHMVTSKSRTPCATSGARRHLLLGALGTVLTARPALAGLTSHAEALRVVRRGAGRDVVFLPGLGASGDVWAASASTLSARVRSHVVHFAGFAGEPAKPSSDDGFLRSRASAVADYLVRQRLSRPLVVAHSGAAAMAMMLALEQPSLLEGLMLVDGLPFPGAVALGEAASQQQAADKAEADYRIQRSMRSAEYAAYRHQEAGNSTVLASNAYRVAEWAIRSNRELLMQADRELGALDLRERLAGLRTALTVVYADQVSLGAPPGWMKQMYRSQYASAAQPPTLVEVAGARHFVMLDQPQTFVAAVRRFAGVAA